MRVHNRYLPDAAHRIANGVVAAAILATIAVLMLTSMPVTSAWWRFAWWLLYAALPAGLLFAFVAPRVSLVRRIAGADGYDELK